MYWVRVRVANPPGLSGRLPESDGDTGINVRMSKFYFSVCGCYIIQNFLIWQFSYQELSSR